ncbi:MAG: hypothetical protein PHC45_04950, partial [Clostridiaceae bacterium]|nr:hypothetical protein [Clostridiaceae bacterium]
DNPTDMHAIYTWSNPPSTIMPNETVTLKLEQNVISNRNGNYNIGLVLTFIWILKIWVSELPQPAR